MRGSLCLSLFVSVVMGLLPSSELCGSQVMCRAQGEKGSPYSHDEITMVGAISGGTVPGSMVTLSAMRTSYDAADSPNDMPRTTSRSTNGQIMGAGDAHLRRISCAGKIIVAAP